MTLRGFGIHVRSHHIAPGELKTNDNRVPHWLRHRLQLHHAPPRAGAERRTRRQGQVPGRLMAPGASLPESELSPDETGIDSVGRDALGRIGTDVCFAAACAGYSGNGGEYYVDDRLPCSYYLQSFV